MFNKRITRLLNSGAFQMGKRQGELCTGLTPPKTQRHDYDAFDMICEGCCVKVMVGGRWRLARVSEMLDQNRIKAVYSNQVQSGGRSNVQLVEIRLRLRNSSVAYLMNPDDAVPSPGDWVLARDRTTSPDGIVRFCMKPGKIIEFNRADNQSVVQFEDDQSVAQVHLSYIQMIERNQLEALCSLIVGSPIGSEDRTGESVRPKRRRRVRKVTDSDYVFDDDYAREDDQDFAPDDSEEYEDDCAIVRTPRRRRRIEEVRRPTKTQADLPITHESQTETSEEIRNLSSSSDTQESLQSYDPADKSESAVNYDYDYPEQSAIVEEESMEAPKLKSATKPYQYMDDFYLFDCLCDTDENDIRNIRDKSTIQQCTRCLSWQHSECAQVALKNPVLKQFTGYHYICPKCLDMSRFKRGSWQFFNDGQGLGRIVNIRDIDYNLDEDERDLLKIKTEFRLLQAGLPRIPGPESELKLIDIFGRHQVETIEVLEDLLNTVTAEAGEGQAEYPSFIYKRLMEKRLNAAKAKLQEIEQRYKDFPAFDDIMVRNRVNGIVEKYRA
ncbi:hypothetical protein ACOME3_002455 [Neoechinorhynchus agilis]